MRPRWGMALAAVAVATFFVVLVAARGLRDADVFWHLATGELILSDGVPRTDPFSFTWLGQPWVAHEWLGQVLVYGLVSLLGAVGASVIFGLLIAAAPLLVAVALARRGVPVPVLIALLAVAVYVLAPFATVRPQALSWLLLAVLIVVLLGLRDARLRWALALVPMFVLWANLHGLYAVGLAVLALYWALSLLGMTPVRARRWVVGGVLVGCVLGSLVTPHGFEGLTYPLRYLEPGDWGQANIQEWQPPRFTDPRHWGLPAVIGALLAVGWRAPGWTLVVAWAGVVGGLLAIRNAPLAVLLAMPALGFGLGAWLERRGGRPVRTLPAGRRAVEAAFVAVVLVATVVILPPAVGAGRPLAEFVPVRAFDALLEHDTDPRVLTEYGWGGYGISRLWPTGGLVFVDGRNDMYDESILDDYSRLRAAEDGWEALADSYGVEAIIMPRSAPLVGAAGAAGWCELHADPMAVVLVRC